MSRYERITFLQDDESARDFFTILDHDGCDAALDFLAQWHYPGEYQCEGEPSHGAADETYTREGYSMSWNRALGYCGLEFDTWEIDGAPDAQEDVTSATSFTERMSQITPR